MTPSIFIGSFEVKCCLFRKNEGEDYQTLVIILYFLCVENIFPRR